MADNITNQDVTPKPVSIEDYIPSQDTLKALRANLGPSPTVPSMSQIREKFGDISKPITSFQDYSDREAKISSALGDIVSAESALKQRLGALETQQELEKRTVDAAQKKYAADKADEVRRGQQQILDEIEIENKRELHFTQENVTSLATLFSLLGVVAIGGGAGTKLSAMNSMNAMTGMLKGWQQGRADLWSREKAEFEKNMAQTKNKLATYAQKAELAWKTMPYDLEKANAIMSELVAETGSQIVKAKAELQGIPETAKYLSDLRTGFDKQFDKFLKEKSEERAGRKETREEQKFKWEKGVKERELGLKEREVKAKEEKAAGGGKTPASQVTSERVMQQDIGNAVFNLKDLKAIGEEQKSIPGGSIAFAGKFSGDISSYIKRYVETQTIEDNPQTIDALMTNLAFDIASAQTGGRGQLSDTKVKAVVSQMPLESQPEKVRKARWRAVVTRVDEANKTLPSNKQIEIPQDVKKYFGVETSEASEVERGSDSRGNFHWEYNADRTQRRKVYD